jgi:hypothetical protein
MRVLLFSVCAAALLLSACSRDYKNFSDDANRFSVDYPRSWQIKPGAQTGVAVTFESPMEGLSDDFLENFSVTAGGIPAAMNEKDFADAVAAAPRAYVPKFRMITEGRIEKLKYPCWRISYEGELADQKLVWEQYFFVKKGMGYSLVFTVSPQRMDACRKIFDQVVGSFRIR